MLSLVGCREWPVPRHPWAVRRAWAFMSRTTCGLLLDEVYELPGLRNRALLLGRGLKIAGIGIK